MLHRSRRVACARTGNVVVDGTLGGGGHTRALAERLGSGLSSRWIATQSDRARARLAGLPVKLAQVILRPGACLPDGITEVNAMLWTSAFRANNCPT